MKLIFTIGMISSLAVAFAAEDLLTKPVDQLSAEEKERRHQILLYKRTGGFIIRREENSGFFAFVNAQNRVSESAYINDIIEMCRICKIDFETQCYKGEVSWTNAYEALKKSNANAALFISDLPNVRETILLAPESRWGIVNVAALAADRPTKELLEKRVRREVWRGFSMVAGSPSTEMNHCLLNPVLSLRDLDAIPGNTFSPEPLMRMEKQLNMMGIKKYYRCSYKTACKQGWAPAPTNDVQKAIYESVKRTKD